MMKKITMTLVLLALTAAGVQAAALRLGLYYGPQTINEAKIDSAYLEGRKSVFSPCFEAEIWKGLTIGAGTEFGYDRRGRLGPEQSPATLGMSGWNVFLGYEIHLKQVGIFVHGGYVRASYRQTIDNPELSAFPVDQKKNSFFGSAGLKLYPLRFLYLSLKCTYVPLKVKPYDIEVDLGGFRFQGGLGFSLNL